MKISVILFDKTVFVDITLFNLTLVENYTVSVQEFVVSLSVTIAYRIKDIYTKS